MKLEALEKNEVIRVLVTSILSDKKFKDKCKDNFEQIFDDNKVDRDDIPLIINLFLTVYNNHNKVEISKIQLKPVFMLLIARLLMEFQTGDHQIDKDLILLLIEPQIDLLVTSIQLSSKCKFPCCGSKPIDTEENESSMYQKMKLNKIEKQRKLSESLARKVAAAAPGPAPGPAPTAPAPAPTAEAPAPAPAEPVIPPDRVLRKKPITLTYVTDDS
jgi:hypothetical protein